MAGNIASTQSRLGRKCSRDDNYNTIYKVPETLVSIAASGAFERCALARLNTVEPTGDAGDYRNS